MLNSNSKNKSTEIIQNLSLLDEHLTMFEMEASELFKLLDKTSNAIRKLESSLQKLNANFPFSLLVREDEESIPKTPEVHHQENIPGIVEAYTTQTIWYLSWDEDTKSNTYRLFLIAQKIEYIYVFVENYLPKQKFAESCIFKEPFIATKLNLRLRFSEFLIPFIEAFTKYLNKFRLNIENKNELPF